MIFAKFPCRVRVKLPISHTCPKYQKKSGCPNRTRPNLPFLKLWVNWFISTIKKPHFFLYFNTKFKFICHINKKNEKFWEYFNINFLNEFHRFLRSYAFQNIACLSTASKHETRNWGYIEWGRVEFSENTVYFRYGSGKGNFKDCLDMR